MRTLVAWISITAVVAGCAPRAASRARDANQDVLVLDQPYVDESVLWLPIRNTSREPVQACVLSWDMARDDGGGAAGAVGGACRADTTFLVVAAAATMKQRVDVALTELGRPGEPVEVRINLRYRTAGRLEDLTLSWRGAIRR